MLNSQGLTRNLTCSPFLYFTCILIPEVTDQHIFSFNKHLSLQPLIFFLFKTTNKCTTFYEFKLKMNCDENDLQSL